MSAIVQSRTVRLSVGEKFTLLLLLDQPDGHGDVRTGEQVHAQCVKLSAKGLATISSLPKRMARIAITEAGRERAAKIEPGLVALHRQASQAEKKIERRVVRNYWEQAIEEATGVTGPAQLSAIEDIMRTFIPRLSELSASRFRAEAKIAASIQRLVKLGKSAPDRNIQAWAAKLETSDLKALMLAHEATGGQPPAGWTSRPVYAALCEAAKRGL